MKLNWPRRFSAIDVLIAIVLLIGFSPFAGQLPGGMGVEAALLSAVFLLAVLAIGEEAGPLKWAALLVVPTLVARWIYHFHRELLPHAVFLVGASAFTILVVILLLRFILRASVVNAEVLCAGIVVFLMLGMIWAFGYTLAARINPSAFVFAADGASDRTMDGFTAFYFSFMTLTGAGCGDITPLSRTVRMFTMVEAMLGLFYVAVLVARLVSLYCTPNVSVDQNK